jgi:hypothetical protein
MPKGCPVEAVHDNAATMIDAMADHGGYRRLIAKVAVTVRQRLELSELMLILGK